MSVACYKVLLKIYSHPLSHPEKVPPEGNLFPFHASLHFSDVQAERGAGHDAGGVPGAVAVAAALQSAGPQRHRRAGKLQLGDF